MWGKHACLLRLQQSFQAPGLADEDEAVTAFTNLTESSCKMQVDGD